MKLVALGLVLLGSAACVASSATPVHVARAGKPSTAVAGRPWTLRLTVQPASFAGPVRVTASGSRRIHVRASGKRGAYRARLVFPKPGRWTLSARAGGSLSRLGSVRVRPAAPQPLVFLEPTSIDVEPGGTLLLVENNPGSLLRVDPRSGRVTRLLRSISRPYAVAHAPSGSIFLSNGGLLSRLDGANLTTVAAAGTDVGPITVAPNGDVYYSTSTQVFRLAGGVGTPVLVASQLSAPHGLAVAADGALLVADTGTDRILRVDPSGGVTTFAQVGMPDGMDVATDGSVYVVDGRAERVVHLSASGARLGLVGPAFQTPYDVEAAPGGVVYVLEAGPAGRVRRVAPNGTVTTVSRRP